MKYIALSLVFFLQCSCNRTLAVSVNESTKNKIDAVESEYSEISHNKNTKFEALFLKYDKIEVLSATWHISPYFKRKYEEWVGFEDDLFTFELGVFYDENAHLLEMDKHLTDCDFERIERWQLMHEKLYSVPVSRDEGVGVEFAMIIFYMKNGEKFYSRFINRGIGQYFGSLSSRGSSLLLDSVLYYLTFADSDAVEAFFTDYFETFQNLTENPPYYE